MKLSPLFYWRSAVLVFLCLVTFNPNDWSLNSTGSPKTQNWIGIVGSVIADLLLQVVGLTAYFLPAFCWL
jgi:S-DNA-T family DNA segregation ATPase FtsK/SpoIIIE